MKYYIKLALITLLVSVAAAEVFGPLVGMRGYIGPAVMALFSSDTDERGTAQLELANPGAPSSADTLDTTPISAASAITADVALDSCVSAIKSVSLHPEFAQVPAVAASSANGIFTFDWGKSSPTRMMNSTGNELNVSASCRIGDDGRFRTLVLGNQELFSNTDGKGSVLGAWRIGRSISKVDRSTNVTVSTRSITPVSINGKEYSPTLVLHCGENKTVSYIKLGTGIGSGKVAVNTTIKGAQTSSRWSISADGKNIYQGSKYITLLRQLTASTLYSVSFSPSGKDPVTLDFALHGLKAAINPLQEACHWR